MLYRCYIVIHYQIWILKRNQLKTSWLFVCWPLPHSSCCVFAHTAAKVSIISSSSDLSGPSRSGTCLEKEVMWSCTSHSCEEPQSGYCFTPGMWFWQWRTFATSACPPIEQIASENATKEFFCNNAIKKIHFGSSKNISVNSSKKNHFLNFKKI